MNPKKPSIPKLAERGKVCFFLGFGNTTKNILYWDPSDPKSWNRAHHARINEVQTFHSLKNMFSTNIEEVQINKSNDQDESLKSNDNNDEIVIDLMESD